MPKRKSVTQAMLTKLLKSIKAAGLAADKFEMMPDGTITITTKIHEEKALSKSNDWDDILEN